MAWLTASWRLALDHLLAREPALYAAVLRLLRSPDLGRRIFVALIRRGDLVFDVGANRGVYTTLFARLVGPAGQVHAFEPVPPTCELLKEALRAQAIENVVVNRTALGEAPGELPLYVPGEDLGQASLIRHHSGSWAEATAVTSYPARVETVDGYVRRCGISRLGFVKCDVEGAELSVLRGATETLRRLKPLLYLEVCADWTAEFGYAPSALPQLLRSLGYTDFYLVGTGLRRLTEPEGELAAERLGGSADLLCAMSGHRARLDRLPSLAGGLRWS